MQLGKSLNLTLGSEAYTCTHTTIEYVVMVEQQGLVFQSNKIY